MSSAVPSPALSPDPPPWPCTPQVAGLKNPPERSSAQASCGELAGRSRGFLGISQLLSGGTWRREPVGRPGGALPDNGNLLVPKTGVPCWEDSGSGQRANTGVQSGPSRSLWALDTSPLRHLEGRGCARLLSKQPLSVETLVQNGTLLGWDSTWLAVVGSFAVQAPLWGPGHSPPYTPAPPPPPPAPRTRKRLRQAINRMG